MGIIREQVVLENVKYNSMGGWDYLYITDLYGEITSAYMTKD